MSNIATRFCNLRGTSALCPPHQLLAGNEGTLHTIARMEKEPERVPTEGGM